MIDNSLSLEANLSAWRLLSLNASSSGERRYASYRAIQVEYVSTVDDRTAMGEPPPGAAFYPSKIYYGRSYEAVVNGSSQSLHAGVGAEFRLVSGDIGGFSQSHSLEMHVFGLGLQPKSGSAIFARTPSDVERDYFAAGPAVPILIEYRAVPGASGASASIIQWAAPRSVDVTFDTLDVGEDGSLGSTPWFLKAFCEVNGSKIPVADDVALRGERVNKGVPQTINWHTHMALADGDALSCGAEGKYEDWISGGQLPVARMSEAIVVRGPGTASGSFDGFNAEASYRVNFRVTVKAE